MSFYICIGRAEGWFSLHGSAGLFRLSLLWITIGVAAFDMEQRIADLTEELHENRRYAR